MILWLQPRRSGDLRGSRVIRRIGLTKREGGSKADSTIIDLV